MSNELIVSAIPTMFYGAAGSITLDRPMPHIGITHKQDDASHRFYGGGRYWVGESMSIETAKAFATAMGWHFINHVELAEKAAAAANGSEQ